MWDNIFLKSDVTFLKVGEIFQVDKNFKWRWKILNRIWNFIQEIRNISKLRDEIIFQRDEIF